MPKYVLKVVVIGDGGVGKTSLVRRFVKNIFNNDYKLTIGSDFGVKKLHIEWVEVVVSIFDIGGTESVQTYEEDLIQGSIGGRCCF